jgi:hypothetical protein
MKTPEQDAKHDGDSIKFDAIGDRPVVVGDRGEWDVHLDVEIEGQRYVCRVRDSVSNFRPLLLRDAARLLRDRVQKALCQGTQLYGAFPYGKSVIAFRSSDFSGDFRPPKSRVKMNPRS